MTLIERLREAADICEATGQPTNAALFREAADAMAKTTRKLADTQYAIAFALEKAMA